jgi:hypothetical protein
MLKVSSSGVRTWLGKNALYDSLPQCDSGAEGSNEALR